MFFFSDVLLNCLIAGNRNNVGARISPRELFKTMYNTFISGIKYTKSVSFRVLKRAKYRAF